VSREGARRPADTAPTGGTPIWVWVVYGLGILATTIMVASLLFVAGAYIASDDVPVTFSTSWMAIVLWGGLIVRAIGTWLSRRRGGGR